MLAGNGRTEQQMCEFKQGMMVQEAPDASCIFMYRLFFTFTCKMTRMYVTISYIDIEYVGLIKCEVGPPGEVPPFSAIEPEDRRPQGGVFHACDAGAFRAAWQRTAGPIRWTQ